MYREKKVLAIIPARGRSKRLPSKNILDLAGKPMIAWTIDAAKSSKYIDKIIVSTDNEKIVEISVKSGAEVPFIRPKELASDAAKTIDVIFHAINFLNNKNDNFEYVILLQPTSPLRTAIDIDAAFEMLDDRTQGIVSVCEAEHSPIWSNILPDDLSMKDFIRKEIINTRSQDLPKYYRLNGAIYISEMNYLIENGGFFGSNTKAFILPHSRSIDIDSEDDFILLKFLLSTKHNS